MCMDLHAYVCACMHIHTCEYVPKYMFTLHLYAYNIYASIYLSIRAEYFSMIYVRSVLSIRVFPRVTLCLYAVYNLYVYIYPTGFHLLALFVFFVAMLLLMLLCVTRFEVDALYRGEVSSEHPRSVYVYTYVYMCVYTCIYWNIYVCICVYL